MKNKNTAKFVVGTELRMLIMEVFQLTLTFSGLIGIILFLFLSSDSANTKNLYLKEANKGYWNLHKRYADQCEWTR